MRRPSLGDSSERHRAQEGVGSRGVPWTTLRIVPKARISAIHPGVVHADFLGSLIPIAALSSVLIGPISSAIRFFRH
jgi:hypothetical protein